MREIHKRYPAEREHQPNGQLYTPQGLILQFSIKHTLQHLLRQRLLPLALNARENILEQVGYKGSLVRLHGQVINVTNPTHIGRHRIQRTALVQQP